MSGYIGPSPLEPAMFWRSSDGSIVRLDMVVAVQRRDVDPAEGPVLLEWTMIIHGDPDPGGWPIAERDARAPIELLEQRYGIV